MLERLRKGMTAVGPRVDSKTIESITNPPWYDQSLLTVSKLFPFGKSLGAENEKGPGKLARSNTLSFVRSAHNGFPLMAHASPHSR